VLEMIERKNISITHFMHLTSGRDCCLCGNSDAEVNLSTDLGRVNCVSCLNTARDIAVRVANLFVFFKQGIMADGSVREFKLSDEHLVNSEEIVQSEKGEIEGAKKRAVSDYDGSFSETMSYSEHQRRHLRGD
jgi:hypothetical protein